MLKTKFEKIALPILCIVILALVYIDGKFILKKSWGRHQFVKQMTNIVEANKDPVFKVSKILKYSGADTEDKTSDQTLQDLSIHQYSDMAFYIDNLSNELTEKNTVRELYLDNFKIDVGYEKGIHTLYYKNPKEISKFRRNGENEIKDRLDYEIVYTNEENKNSNYDKPIFFTDCSNPITIEFVNEDIVTNYQVTKENGMVSFDGRIFNNLDLDLEKLSPKISFTIHLKNNLNESFVCNVSANMKLQTEEGSVKNGYIIEKIEDIDYYRFFKEV